MDMFITVLETLSCQASKKGHISTTMVVRRIQGTGKPHVCPVYVVLYSVVCIMCSVAWCSVCVCGVV